MNLVPAVKKANEMKIPVINVDDKIDEKPLKDVEAKTTAYISTDNVQVGGKAAEYVRTRVSSGNEVAIIEGMSGVSESIQRRDGFRSKAEARGLKVVTSQPADWDRIKAWDVATNVMNRFPNLKAIYCCNDTMALRAVQATENAGKLGKVIIAATDGIDEAVESVKAGKLDATIAQDPYEEGATALRTLLSVISFDRMVT